MNEQMVREQLRLRADQAPDGPTDLERLWDEGRNQRRRHRGWLVVGSAAVAVVVVFGVLFVRADSSGSTAPSNPSDPSATGSSDNPHNVLTPEMLQMRGRELAAALNLREMATNDAGTSEPGGCSDQPGAAFAEYVDGRGYCVAVGNAPDNWLASYLVGNQWSPDERLLHTAGVPWTAELPPPPPIVVDLLSARVAELETQGNEDTPEFWEAKFALNQARGTWAGLQPSWDAAGWNAHYWGDPWWPVG
jgi:hypothetical protein